MVRIKISYRGERGCSCEVTLSLWATYSRSWQIEEVVSLESGLELDESVCEYISHSWGLDWECQREMFRKESLWVSEFSGESPLKFRPGSGLLGLGPHMGPVYFHVYKVDVFMLACTWHLLVLHEWKFSGPERNLSCGQSHSYYTKMTSDGTHHCVCVCARARAPSRAVFEFPTSFPSPTSNVPKIHSYQLL